MLIIRLACLGGVPTIVSPCILRVLPFVFARADRSFLRSTGGLFAGQAKAEREGLASLIPHGARRE